MSLSVPRGAVPLNEREHEPAGAVVVPRADLHPRRDGRVADEAPQELLRGQEARLIAGSIRYPLLRRFWANFVFLWNSPYSRETVCILKVFDNSAFLRFKPDIKVNVLASFWIFYLKPKVGSEPTCIFATVAIRLFIVLRDLWRKARNFCSQTKAWTLFLDDEYLCWVSDGEKSVKFIHVTLILLIKRYKFEEPPENTISTWLKNGPYFAWVWIVYTRQAYFLGNSLAKRWEENYSNRRLRECPCTPCVILYHAKFAKLVFWSRNKNRIQQEEETQFKSPFCKFATNWRVVPELTLYRLKMGPKKPVINFAVGDKVFAKVRGLDLGGNGNGYPFWPAEEFESQCQLQVHKRKVHTGEPLLWCEECDTECAVTRDQLRSHKRLWHPISTKSARE